MDIKQITNKTIRSIDAATNDRKCALQALSSQDGEFHGARPPSVWMTDVSGCDSRSVKYQLNGGFSLRAAWWNLYRLAHKTLAKRGTLEFAMYDFHRMHHASTLAIAQTMHDVNSLYVAIRSEGLVRAAKDYAASVWAEVKSK
jgi:hypothetical protein